jgi:hypothetical protein
MHIKIVTVFITFLVPPSLAFQKPAYSIPTAWEDTKISLKELLNGGWQITGHSSNRVIANFTSLDVRTLSFVLTKGGKYVVCLLENPSPPVANAASCRKLN